MSKEKNPQQNDREPEDRGFKDIPRERMLELARHVAEILRYQKEHDLEDKGDPPDDDSPPSAPRRS